MKSNKARHPTSWRPLKFVGDSDQVYRFYARLESALKGILLKILEEPVSLAVFGMPLLVILQLGHLIFFIFLAIRRK